MMTPTNGSLMAQVYRRRDATRRRSPLLRRSRSPDLPSAAEVPDQQADGYHQVD